MKTQNDFLDQAEPVGAQVKLGKDTPRGRLASSHFQKLLFQYFEELNSGQTGWGVSFTTWLKYIKGWKLLDMRTFERIEPIADDLR